MYIADLHIHSCYSRATSRECSPEYLDLWARRKGIHIVGTGDFTHPRWRGELEEKLEPAEEGLYVLRDEYRIKDGSVFGEQIPRFAVTGEISSIYKKNGKVRKVHSLIILPGLEDAEKISAKLEQIGNIHSDGRPILGLDCRDLLEIVLELCPAAIYVPAHIWTPHFSLFGAFSGFDTAEECFEDLTPYVHAIETGLSSDPPMNWRVSALDRYQLISNSDAHSPAKLGREANLLECELSFSGLSRAIQTGEGLYGTIEFFPEEGKYHMDGHRKCNLCLSPSDTARYKGKCPVCGKKLTVGVLHRIEELADREAGYVRPDAKAFESLVPLPEVIASSLGCSPAAKKVQKEYENMIRSLGPEFDILRNFPLEDIRSLAGGRIAEGIRRLRRGIVERIPGFDGEYGMIRLFCEDELNNMEGQLDFFSLLGAEKSGRQEAPDRTVPQKTPEDGRSEEEKNPVPAGETLNAEQKKAVESFAPRIAVKAGPGTGKTKTLISRLKYLLENRRVSPGEITAVTFTNQAAGEMRRRLGKTAGRKRGAGSVLIGTFHAVCRDFLADAGEKFTLADKGIQKRLAQEVLEKLGLQTEAGDFLEQVSRIKSGVQKETDECEAQAIKKYEERKQEEHLLDFDDLLLLTAQYCEQGNIPEKWKKRLRYLLVDEFQDINPLQHRLLRIWSGTGRELFVIGDPDQAIYGFRGADPYCFDRMEEEQPDLEIIRLKENYRSSPQIIKAASSLWNSPGAVHPNRPDNVPVRLVRAGSPAGEAVFIAKEIARLTGGMGMLEAHRAAREGEERTVRGFGDIGVLCRTHRQADLVEKCLQKESIPCIRSGREDYLEDDTVQGSLAFFRYAADPGNVEAMKECAEKIWHLDWNMMTKEIIENAAGQYRAGRKKSRTVKLLEKWTQEMHLEKSESMQKLLQAAVFYDSVDELLETLDLGAETDVIRSSSGKYNSEAVRVMTFHGAKGLEFPVAFLYGVSRGSIPYEKKNGQQDLQEERRLFYVGMTRAEEELIMTTSGEESVFVQSMDDTLIKREDAVKKKEISCRQMSLSEYGDF